ncbi:ARF GTPase-activating protein GIT1-like isoform X2 [Ornithodoros turicata]|uniref:ARF GTPase-activating protein GIT1-like isoform X2 n=1 Tax=Ornithodoros turicata TaxID=34597 RepID=UPI0031390F85
MSRGKIRMVPEVCADCSAQDPGWASINRGILLCDECCSVHRSLGRHISQVKSLKKGAWAPTQLAMVHALHTSGANSIWEHTLLDPAYTRSGRRKPTPKDILHPVKADFIRAKHQNLAFVHRPGKDEPQPTEEDLSKQLHSSVRTGNMETSLRLLVQGADPNYVHAEKGNTALHMAAKTGQTSQVELLIVYGSDPLTRDMEGRTPIDYAREAGHHDLERRLQECQYEVTDRLAFYLSGRKPDHHLGQHFILPEMSDCLDLSEFAKAAKRKLQALPDNLFEELAMDVYDEVDRRENDAIWLMSQNQNVLVADRQAVPFLPVNPEFSSTRNQGRQKLARFNAREFATLIIDILSEAKRRQHGSSDVTLNCINKGLTISNKQPKAISLVNLSDDEPLYDSVASDEENGHEAALAEVKATQDQQPLVANVSPTPEPLVHSKESYGELQQQLSVSEQRIKELQQCNRIMRHELDTLKGLVQRLLRDNTDLRARLDAASPPLSIGGSPRRSPQTVLHSSGSSSSSNRQSGQRPQSMYEARHLGAPQWGIPGHSNHTHGSRHHLLPRDDSGLGHTHSSQSSRNSGDYDNTPATISRGRWQRCCVPPVVRRGDSENRKDHEANPGAPTQRSGGQAGGVYTLHR